MNLLKFFKKLMRNTAFTNLNVSKVELNNLAEKLEIVFENRYSIIFEKSVFSVKKPKSTYEFFKKTIKYLDYFKMHTKDELAHSTIELGKRE